MTIGDRIRLRREELEMSQEELAKRLGYKSRSSVNKIELNQRNLTQSKIKAIADALMTTPSYIMGWEDTTLMEVIQETSAPDQDDMLIEIYGEEVAELVHLFAKLDDGDKCTALKMMHVMLENEKYST